MNVTQLNATFVDQTFERSNVTDQQPHSVNIFAGIFGVTWFMSMILGIPGNILSMIVWMRHQVISKNSSAVYLTALAINDLIHLLVYLFLVLLIVTSVSGEVLLFVHCFSLYLEPLLVLAFSVERLIAILRPLQVCCSIKSFVIN